MTIIARDKSNLQKAAHNLPQITGYTPNYLNFDLSEIEYSILLDSQIGDLDILVNNAGSIPGGSISSIEIEDWLLSWNL